MTEKISFRTSEKPVYDLDAAVLGDEIRSQVVACIEEQKSCMAEMPRFPVADDALEQTSEARLSQILAAGKDIHGIASDRSISNVISFGSSRNVDTFTSERIKQGRHKLDTLMKAFLESLFDSAYPLTVSSSGHFWYPPGSYMGWHTNSRVPGWRVYINYAEEAGKSFFRFRDPLTEDIVTLDDKVWNIRVFRITSDKPVWHTIYSGTNRFSFGYMVHQQVPVSRLSRWLRKLAVWSGKK